MMPRVLRSKGGFTYVGALVMAVIVGIMASRASVFWSTTMKREREDELISRGTQIRDALRKWYEVKVVEGKLVSSQSPSNGPAVAPAPLAGPAELKALTLRGGKKNERYLRPFCLVDPITLKEWVEIRREGKLVGVKSKSELEPIKQGNFPFDLPPADFEKKKNYSEWEFVYDHVPPPTVTGGAITGLNGSSNPNGSSQPNGGTAGGGGSGDEAPAPGGSGKPFRSRK